jgi:uncharacterized protein (DUF1501 family)
MGKMNRKDFLKFAIASGLFGSALSRPVEAAAPTLNDIVLIHLLMEGGPDFRHLIVPKPDTNVNSYGYNYWKYRAGVHGVDPNSTTAWQNRYATDYEEVEGKNGNQPFGILKKCGWLIQKYKEGKVAIISNVKHSESRDHARSLLVLQKGNYSTAAYTTGGTGWGGRLIGGPNAELNTTQKIVSVTGQIRPFCDGNSANVISFRNSRNFGLFTPDSLNSGTSPSTDSRVVMYRSLKTYYEKKTGLASNFAIFKKHYDQLRVLTDSINTRIKANPLPAGISSLSATGGLNNQDFAKQIQSAYDAYLCKDLLGMRIISMNYGGWDTHKRQKQDFENQIQDIFGTGKGLDQLFINRPSDFANSIILAYGEFGRQLRGNGDNSTDHGDANAIILIGGHVNGGTYGELFPSIEITKYSSFWQGIQSRNNFRAALQSLLTVMGATVTDVFNMSLVSGTDYETGFGNFTQIVT